MNLGLETTPHLVPPLSRLARRPCLAWQIPRPTHAGLLLLLNARARLANYVGSGARKRETGGASERAGERPVCPPSVRPSLPDFANSVRRPFKTATVCAPLVGREREEGEPRARGPEKEEGEKRERGSNSKSSSPLLPPFPLPLHSDGGVTLSSFILT